MGGGGPRRLEVLSSGVEGFEVERFMVADLLYDVTIMIVCLCACGI